jgi:multidrug efflux pump subunit AcrA (membrane-fusion protein)
VSDILAELPPQLQPVVLAKASAKGKGGRHPAADPKALDPDMDPRRARRIMANRQSAARSKLKQKVMMESLRATRELVERGGAAAEVAALREQVTTLSARTQQLESANAALTRQLQVRRCCCAGRFVKWLPASAFSSCFIPLRLWSNKVARALLRACGY